VHAAGRTVEVQRVFEEPGPPRPEGRGIEDPDLDLRMHGEGDQIAVAAKIIVIEQQTHADSAIGGLQQMFRENAARLVGIVDVVLGIDRLVCGVGQGGARHQGFEPIFQNAEPRFAGWRC